jgi:2-oxoglutarate dehydrogenase E2 component (dihydrolipoamide succinyltransferase)
MTTNIVVPELGESVVEARVARWLKQPGEPVAAGDALVELETEKIDLEVSADRPGVLASIKHPEGADVKVGEVLAVLEETPSGAVPQVLQVPLVLQESRLVEMKATPTAKNVARAHDVNLAAVAAFGTRVTKDDVLRVAAPPGTGRTAPVAPPAPKAPEAPGKRLETRQRMSKRRLTIARRLVEAQHAAAMLTTFNEVDMSQVMALRARRKDAFRAAHGVSLGIASFFVKAAIGALKAFPSLNAEIQGDEVVFKHYYDIGVAVAAEGGLVVPVLRDADRLTFAEIERAIRDVAQRADQGTLTLEDLKGGTFTVTNGGVFGSLMSTPILNPPQVGILGLHKIADRAVPIKPGRHPADDVPGAQLRPSTRRRPRGGAVPGQSQGVGRRSRRDAARVIGPERWDVGQVGLVGRVGLVGIG